MSSNIDPKSKYLNEIQKKSKPNMHLKFFVLNPDAEFIRVPIFSKFVPQKKIIPYRNTECTKPGCIYDITELETKFKNSMLNSYLTFTCHNCNNFIELKNFYLDATLNYMIEDVWKNYNTDDKIICENICIMRSGDWEPELPEYISEKFLR